VQQSLDVASMKNSIEKPIWIKIAGSGFAAVLFASVSIGGLGIYRQYLAGNANTESEVANDATAIQADMAAQGRAAAGLALMLAGEGKRPDQFVQAAHR
jgi:methyl-accepting chemotaxis protein